MTNEIPSPYLNPEEVKQTKETMASQGLKSFQFGTLNEQVKQIDDFVRKAAGKVVSQSLINAYILSKKTIPDLDLGIKPLPGEAKKNKTIIIVSYKGTELGRATFCMTFDAINSKFIFTVEDVHV